MHFGFCIIEYYAALKSFKAYSNTVALFLRIGSGDLLIVSAKELRVLQTNRKRVCVCVCVCVGISIDMSRSGGFWMLVECSFVCLFCGFVIRWFYLSGRILMKYCGTHFTNFFIVIMG